MRVHERERLRMKSAGGRSPFATVPGAEISKSDGPSATERQGSRRFEAVAKLRESCSRVTASVIPYENSREREVSRLLQRGRTVAPIRAENPKSNRGSHQPPIR